MQDSPQWVNRLKWLVPALVIVAFCVCYQHTFFWLHYRYSAAESYYSHGYIVPLVSLYLAYLERQKLSAAEIGSCPGGILVIIMALFLHVLATMADINFLSGFSMYFYVVGACLFFFGAKIVRIVMFPLGFLLFMFPIPDLVIDFLGLPTKSIASSIGLSMIDVFGIPYYREGFRIELADCTFVVGTPCNGMKSLISFAALGCVASHMMGTSLLKRIILLVLIYPLAIVLNGVRIAVLVLIAYRFGIENAAPESPLHDLSGLAVFFVGMLVLFALIRFEDKRRRASGTTAEALKPSDSAASGHPDRR
jgi:exosortase